MSETANFLLAQITQKIQLSPTKWDTASSRYETVADYLESEGSAVKGLVKDNYPQGSVRIQSAISSLNDDEQHDIDFITEWRYFPGDPAATIDALYRSLDRGPGSRYHGMCERRNRCVTIHYSDMHIDITPAVRLPTSQHRISRIVDRRLNTEVIANPEGFACWVEEQFDAMPAALIEMRKAEPVDEQQPLETKPATLIGLQLNKRWRSVNYQERDGRKPPSIVLTKMSMDIARQLPRNRDLLGELTGQCAGMIRWIDGLQRARQILHIANPTCPQDVLTDRWPRTLVAQEVFLEDLYRYARDLRELAGQSSMSRKREILQSLFGENATGYAFEELGKRAGRDSGAGQMRRSVFGTTVIVPSASSTLLSGQSQPTKPHGYFGWKEPNG